MTAMILITTAPMTPNIENNKLEFIDLLFGGVVDGGSTLEVSDTNVLSMIVRDIDIEANLSLLLLVITSDKLPVTETINVYIITHQVLCNIHVH